MKETKKLCPKCGVEIPNSNVKVCFSCGTKIGKPIYKKWWFWLIVVLAVAIIGGAFGSGDGEAGSIADNNGAGSSSKTYEEVDLQTMLDELNKNALSAEKKYQNKYVQVKGKISNFDSDGAYISIEPVNADEWNFDTVICYIKSDAQREFLMSKEKGDAVTIKGKITSIGEILGYSINIDEIK